MTNKTKILSICNSKGGVGKSVVTLMMATALAEQKGKKVLILDCDSQATVYELVEQEKEQYPDYEPLVEVEALSPRRVNTFLKRFGDDYDVIFIDIPRMTDKKADNPTVMLLYNCDGILVPVIGSDVDMLATQEFLDVIEECRNFKTEMKEDFVAYGFINRRNARKSNEEAETQIRKDGLKMFSNSLSDLRIFTSPSAFTSPMQTAEGQRRFEEFYKEFCRKFKV
ncbi:MAG: ParA family protein [Granulosicoccus sp.]|nr:ParA family protein [Granulosicoccus sp.]